MPNLDPLVLIFILAGVGLFLIVLVSGIFTFLSSVNTNKAVKMCAELTKSLAELTIIMKNMAEKQESMNRQQTEMSMEILRCRQIPATSPTYPQVRF